MKIKIALFLTVAAGLSGCSSSFNNGGNSAPANTNTNIAKPTITPSAATPTPEVKASPVAIAPKAESGTKRISFKSGESAATVSDSVVRGERSIYIVGAKSGQTMSVEITSLEDNAVFQIKTPGGKFLADAGDGDDATNWDGQLPANGDYKIIVGGTRGNASFKLTVSID